MVISPKVKSLTLLFSLNMDQLDGRRGNTSENFYHFPDSSSLATVHLPQALGWLEISAAHHFFLVSRFVSCIFILAFHVFLDGCWWNLFKSLGMFYCHEIRFNWHGKSRGRNCFLVIWQKWKVQKNRTLRVCMNSEFFGFNTEVFAILWYFQ